MMTVKPEEFFHRINAVSSNAELCQHCGTDTLFRMFTLTISLVWILLLIELIEGCRSKAVNS